MSSVLLLKNRNEDCFSPYKYVIIDYPYKPKDKPNWDEFVNHCEQLRELAKKTK